MGNKYRLEVITDQLKSDSFLPRVRVIMDYSEEHYINTFADLSDDKQKERQVIPQDRKSTRLNSSHSHGSRMPSSA